MKNIKKVLIAIATYKEAENIENLISKIRQYDNHSKILIINDFSNDKTKEILENINDKNLEFIERKKLD